MSDNRSAFDAANYDEKIKRTLPYYDEFYRQAADAARLYCRGPLSWLDVGCGTGKMAEVAFGELEIKRFVFCDCAAEMIEIAKRRFGDRSAEFLTADVRELAFDGCFDVVTAIQVNHYLHLEAREQALKSCCRSLREGGLLVSFENFAPSSGAGERLYLERWGQYQRRQGRSPGECEAHINRYKQDYFPITVPEHLEVMKKAGFRVAEILWLSYMQVGLLGIK